MKNDQFSSPDSPSGFDPNLDSSRVHTANGHVKKDAMQSDQEGSPRSSSSANSATDDKKLSLRLSMIVEKTEKIKAQGVFNLLPKDKVTPSGSGTVVNSMVTENELPIRVRILKSDHSQGDDHVQKETSSKRKLGSTPSPGGGD